MPSDHPTAHPSQGHPLPTSQVPATFLLAATTSLVASIAEMRQVAQVWLACERDSAGMGFGFLLFHLPVLLLGQTLAVGALASAVLMLVGPRPVAVPLAVAVGLAVLVGCAFAYFHVNGLPMANEFCRTTQPTWWP
ncbi:hypothetical protein DLE60_02040 [Micromonospora globispora]|nr:hypothetical protein DLE60_02040 [Micromonospora globispora]RQW87738.1 hypothetical protein DKL51_25545 [Micromonospora globispora]